MLKKRAAVQVALDPVARWRKLRRREVTPTTSSSTGAEYRAAG